MHPGQVKFKSVWEGFFHICELGLSRQNTYLYRHVKLKRTLQFLAQDEQSIPESPLKKQCWSLDKMQFSIFNIKENKGATLKLRDFNKFWKIG